MNTQDNPGRDIRYRVIERDRQLPVPPWAMVLAVLAFVAIQVIVHVGLGDGENAPPLSMRFFMGPMIGAILATFVILIGYVNRDAGRRGMSRSLWTLLAIFVPNGIGLVLYFVLRRPLQDVCPHCGSAVPTKANYCPRCSHRLGITCQQCGNTVDAADIYCASCGQPLRTGATELANR